MDLLDNTVCLSCLDSTALRKFTCFPNIIMLPGKLSKKKNRLPMACREGIWDADHPGCQIKDDKIMTPLDMD